MTARILSIYMLALVLFTSPLTAESAPSAAALQTTAATSALPMATQTAPESDAAALQTETAAEPYLYKEARPADWAFVMRDEGNTTYLRMDTIRRADETCGTVFYGDLKNIYTKHGLLHVYYSIKNSREMDDESLAVLKQIDHSLTHVSYRTDGSHIFYRLHRVTFYNKSGNPIETFDFDDIARQTDTEVEWQEVTQRMIEERAIFYRLVNG